MEFHQVVALSIVIAMAFVADSTIKLFRYRRRNRDELKPMQLRDLAILRKPGDFSREEARLTYRNWISCAAMLALVILFLAIAPADVTAPAASAG